MRRFRSPGKGLRAVSCEMVYYNTRKTRRRVNKNKTRATELWTEREGSAPTLRQKKAPDEISATLQDRCRREARANGVNV